MTILARAISVEEVGRDQFAVFVVIVRVAGQDDPEAVADGDARGADEETAGEGLAAGAADGVEGLPGDEHGDDGGLAGAGGELQGDAEKLGIGVLVGGFEVIEKFPAPLALVRGDFGEPDGGFDGFDLAEEGADAGKGVLAPVLEQAGGFGRDLPLVRVGEFAPLIHVPADFVDDGVGVVLLLSGGNAFFVFEKDFALLVFAGLAALLRLRHGGDEGGAAA